MATLCCARPTPATPAWWAVAVQGQRQRQRQGSIARYGLAVGVTPVVRSLAHILLPMPAASGPQSDKQTLSTPARPARAQRGFAQRHMPDYPLFNLVSLLYEVVPDILMQTGKVGGGTSPLSRICPACTQCYQCQNQGGSGWGADDSSMLVRECGVADQACLALPPCAGEEPLAQRGCTQWRAAAGACTGQGAEHDTRPDPSTRLLSRNNPIN